MSDRKTLKSSDHSGESGSVRPTRGTARFPHVKQSKVVRQEFEGIDTLPQGVIRFPVETGHHLLACFARPIDEDLTVHRVIVQQLFFLALFCGLLSTQNWLHGGETVSQKHSGHDDFSPLFDGKSFNGWDGDQKVFRIDDGAIIGGQMREKIPHNFFLSTKEEYSDFELKLEFRLLGDDTNAGIQIRSRRIPDHHEMIGYQADLGQNYWGALYDESRRNRILASPKKEELAKVLKLGDWNTYRILCEGKRIQLWINDFQTVDYTETDDAIEQNGQIALQIHGGPPGEAQYRNIRIKRIE